MPARTPARSKHDQASPLASPAAKEMLDMLTKYGMDDEDLALLRAQGVKSVKDFSRIKDLMELNLPPVTREKVRDLVAFLRQDADQAPGGSALSRMRTSLGGLLGAVSAYLPSPARPAAPTSSSAAVKAGVVKPKGGIKKDSNRGKRTARAAAPPAAEDTETGAAGAEEEEGGGSWLPHALGALSNLGQVLPWTPSKASQRGAPARDEQSPTLAAAEAQDAEAAGGAHSPCFPGRKKQQNRTQTLGLPSQQLEAGTKRAAPQRARQGKGKPVQVKEANVFKLTGGAYTGMRLRAKRNKKGFYNLKHLEHLVWCKGRGTYKDPFVID